MRRFDKKLAKLFDWEWVYTFQMNWTQCSTKKKTNSVLWHYGYILKKKLLDIEYFFFKSSFSLKKEILRIKD